MLRPALTYFEETLQRTLGRRHVLSGDRDRTFGRHNPYFKETATVLWGDIVVLKLLSVNHLQSIDT